MKSNIFGKMTILLGLYFLFSFSFIFSRGFFTLSGSVMFLASIVLLIVFLIKPNLVKVNLSRKRFIQLLSVSLFLNLNLTWFLYGGLYQSFQPALNISYSLLRILVFLSFFLFLATTRKFLKVMTGIFFVFWLSLHLLMISSSPRPWIDVYEILKRAPEALFHGLNPYSIDYKQMYFNVRPNFFSYFPFMFLFSAPFVFLFNDPRFGFVLAQALTFIIIAFKFSWKNKDFGGKFSFLMGLLILFQPLALYLTEQSYTEPLILLQLTLLLYFLFKQKKLAAFVLGMGLATKQYFVLVALFLKKRLFNNKELLVTIITTLFIVGPFFLISPKDFIYDTFLIMEVTPPRYDGLTFFSTAYQLTKIPYSKILALGVWIITFFCLTKSSKEFKNNFIIKLAIFLGAFFYFNKWGYVNYYYLVSNLILLSIYIQIYQVENKILLK
ncbi:hypothetical protein COT75_00630 [Candidatus Beckwithbacteria bacterium CG10_big_fil_rev_8_21_14_0_10_34_10]|uniref:Glycosyltransferase RgtA/B/C/D-like domain-containing protein n=1 Tax=Candidatus Beckwithbacteria bacterium CG10_big_fil_rev_8_21_14_0_10_34_10 TaxID=1974495 RepID=A0A2H0WAM4_9BACT|nr:MAG: hypothetical protein COT75_00630 [Candidatus Beckwithbacteria bacterium CG10_big_fil_rev_8_21_14_0_10_34_10]